MGAGPSPPFFLNLQTCYATVTQSTKAFPIIGCMHIEETEIDSRVADWSPGKISEVELGAEEILEPFLRSQRAVLLRLRRELFDTMAQVAGYARAPSEISLVQTHEADAGTDAYDRDFALRLLSHEHDALYEIDQALSRIEAGTYGICEASGKPIPHERLQAIPFARFTVDVQSRLEREEKAVRLSERAGSLFPFPDDEDEEQDGDEKGVARAEERSPWQQG